MAIHPLIFVLLAASAGIAVGMQAPVNAALGRSLGSGVMAACLSFGIGFLALLLVGLVIGQGKAMAAAPGLPLWQFLGGMLGAFFVWAMLTSVPVVGVLTATAGLIMGQMVAALVIDMVGAFGLPRHPVSWQRLLAVAMVAGGLILSRA